jgi:hypothetical protein
LAVTAGDKSTAASICRITEHRMSVAMARRVWTGGAAATSGRCWYQRSYGEREGTLCPRLKLKVRLFLEPVRSYITFPAVDRIHIHDFKSKPVQVQRLNWLHFMVLFWNLEISDRRSVYLTGIRICRPASILIATSEGCHYSILLMTGTTWVRVSGRVTTMSAARPVSRKFRKCVSDKRCCCNSS